MSKPFLPQHVIQGAYVSYSIDMNPPTIGVICHISPSSRTFHVAPLDTRGLADVVGPYPFDITDADPDLFLTITPLTEAEAHEKAKAILAEQEQRFLTLTEQRDAAFVLYNTLCVRANTLLGL